VVGVEPDRWVWKPGEGGVFSVKSCYDCLQKLDLTEEEVSREEGVLFRELWKCRAPSKALAFSWKLILDRIPTKVNLAKRRLLSSQDSKRCVFCGLVDETSVHLFLHCNVISQVWRGVMNWMQINFITPPNLLTHFLGWSSALYPKKSRKGLLVIWNAVIWIVWKMRNGRIFNNVISGIDEMVEQVKVISWHWCMNRVKIPTCLFYEWCWNPRECLSR
jgi:hypothetical protein